MQFCNTRDTISTSIQQRFVIDKFLEGLTSDGADLPVNKDKQIDKNIIDEIKTADLFVSSSQKQMIINSYKSKLLANPKLSIRQARSLISKELGIGVTTISNTLTEYRNFKTVSSFNRTNIFKNVTDKVDDFDKEAIRKQIHQFG
ncbi:hypothetical protein QTP88_010712 [Uroleucon formosanum]